MNLTLLAAAYARGGKDKTHKGEQRENLKKREIQTKPC